MRGLTLAEADRLRRTPGASVVLFLTDRCPVGCAHCSVSSTVAGPTIRDWALFTQLVEGIAALPDVQVVPITGGEPFAHRRGLTYAVDRLTAAGKRVVLFTSGFWARSGPPAWVGPVLSRTDAVYLSVDSYHATGVRDLAPAVAAVTRAGCRLVLQVLDEPGARSAAQALAPTAEIRLTRLLPVGRGAALPTRTTTPTPVMGACSLLHSPTVRYDGRVTACCHEAVIMGAGPASLHRRASTAVEVAQAIDSLRREPVLRLMARFGSTAVSSLAAGSAGSAGSAGGACAVCWAAQERVATDPVAAVTAAILAGPAPAGAA